MRAKFQKIVTCVAFSIKFAETNQKFAENFEFCEKNSLLLVNYSLHSLIVSVFSGTTLLAQLGGAGRHGVSFSRRARDHWSAMGLQGCFIYAKILKI